MSNSSLTVLVVLVAVVSLGSLALSAALARSTVRTRRGRTASPLPTDLDGLRDEVERLRREAAGAVRHLAVVRYDAFGDMGGRLSWSMAVLDDGGNGVVVTSIHGRSDARTYAKNVVQWSGDQQLSPEEADAVQQAKLNG